MTTAAGAAVAVVGPTTVGKTRLAVELARRIGGEIVGADSRQALRGLRVATNAPDPAELRGVPVHCVAVAEPGASFTLADWLRLARDAVAQIHGRGALPIVVGGTGLYVNALIEGYDLGAVPPDAATRAARLELASRPEGLAALVAELRVRDPERAARVDLANPRRVVRALEVVDAAPGEPAGLTARPRSGGAPLRATWIGLDTQPEVQRQWVRARVSWMFDSGAIAAEVAAALDNGVPPAALEAAGIGYREALQERAGLIGRNEAAALTVRRTLRYVKAQRTWFRANPGITWLDAAAPLDELADTAVSLLESAQSDCSGT